ncbi:MAG: T9SS type A sorting domain-containing protein [Dysgonamonadaceae bacterium]|jgi:hypothetical protein|nr:T9SS type A sorting domain-containing protein [Dysgonamonadaceae bacterium]
MKFKNHFKKNLFLIAIFTLAINSVAAQNILNSAQKTRNNTKTDICKTTASDIPVLTLLEDMIVYPKVVNIGEETRVVDAFTGNLNAGAWEGKVCFLIFDAEHNVIDILYAMWIDEQEFQVESRQIFGLQTEGFSFSAPGTYYVSEYCKPKNETEWIRVASSHNNYVQITVAEPNANAYLKDIQVDWQLSPAFDPAITNYTMTVESTVDVVNIISQTSHENATVSGNGLHPIPEGNSSVSLKAESPDKSVSKNYTFNIVRDNLNNSSIFTMGNYFAILDINYNNTNQINIGQPFIIEAEAHNIGGCNWGGNYGIIIFDEQGNIVDIIPHDYYLSSPPGWGWWFYMYVNNEIIKSPGVYHISLFYKSIGGDWIKVSDKDYFKNDLQINIGETNDIKSISDISLQIYPNPAKDYLFIQSDYPVERVEIYNQSGTCVMINENVTEKLDISGLADGLYFVRINAKGTSLIQKIIIKKGFI